MMSRSRSRPRSWWTLSIAGVTLVVTGCGGDDEPTPTTAPPATTPTTTTATVATTLPPATATSTDPATTAAVSSTTAPTTAAAPTTSGPPDATQPRNSLPNTIDPQALAVAEAAWAYYDAFNNANADPASPDLEAAALATTTGKATTDVASSLARMREQNVASRSNPTEPARLEITEESITVSVDGAFASLTGCDINTDTLVTPGAGSDGSDEPFSAEFGSVAIEYSLQSVDGRWLVSEVRYIQIYMNQVGCP
jgi:hypothetical protein